MVYATSIVLPSARHLAGICGNWRDLGSIWKLVGGIWGHLWGIWAHLEGLWRYMYLTISEDIWEASGKHLEILHFMYHISDTITHQEKCTVCTVCTDRTVCTVCTVCTDRTVEYKQIR